MTKNDKEINGKTNKKEGEKKEVNNKPNKVEPGIAIKKENKINNGIRIKIMNNIGEHKIGDELTMSKEDLNKMDKIYYAILK